ncbi:hypothetical protein [Sorangium sp. So ce854]
MMPQASRNIEYIERGRADDVSLADLHRELGAPHPGRARRVAPRAAMIS